MTAAQSLVPKRGAGYALGIELLDERVTPATVTVTGLSPTFGPPTGGTLVTITGTGFTGVTAVNFGTVPAAGETVVSPTSITADSPAGTGTVDVTVTASGGTSPITPADEFTYAPTVTGLSPSSGPAAGGTTVTIIGTGFTGATGVDFGTSPATNVSVLNGNSITATSPSGSGVVNVTVTTPAGTSTITPADQFTYPNVPVVTGLSPAMGPATGGTTVVITGTGFTGATAVDFGTTPATDVTDVSDTVVTAVSPAGSGVVDVTVTAPGGTSAVTTADKFTYGPEVTSVSPRSGPAAGHTFVVIMGSSLAGATAVNFGPNLAMVISDTATEIVAFSPAGTGVVDVTVTTPLGTSSTSTADLFFYTTPGSPAPTVSGLNPTGGPPTGGTDVTITGTGYDPASPAAVYFGTAPATGVVVVNSTTITAVSPSGAGTVDVTVVTTGGVSATSPADQFSYGPTVTGISPRSGTIAGGTEVTITGVNLNNVTAVNFGTAAATTLISQSPTQLVVLSPAGAAFGPVDVTVTTAGGTSPTSAADQFVYTSVGAVTPRLTSVSPQFGSPDGGTVVTITGSGFDTASPAVVFFGGTPATSVTVVNNTTLLAVTPAASVGTVTVSVATYGGTSNPVFGAQFTYIVDGPQVTGVLRYGYHAQPTYLVIGFNAALDPATAQNAANYQILSPSGHRIKVRSARYNASTGAVTLNLEGRLKLTTNYRLTINGTAPAGVTDSDGILLDGAYTGAPGSNFVTTVTSGNLAGSASQRPAEAVVKARAKSLLVRLKSAIHNHRA